MMSMFVRSITAANMFPFTLQTVCECVYGEQSSMRLRQAGMEYAVWVFKHARTQQLASMGPVILQALLKYVCV